MLETFVISTFLAIHPPKQPPKVSEYHGTPTSVIAEPLPEALRSPLKLEVAKIEEIPRPAPKPVTQPKLSPSTVPNCGDNEYAHFIYMKESDCNLNAVNSLGCRGIGQACPGSKLPCGADYACQNAYFTNYAISRYGSWKAAYDFWTRNHWW